MALVIQDRVRETTQVVGTGSATLLGAVTGYQSFSTVGNGNTTYYAIADQGGPNWEVGTGTWATGGTLARTTVLSSSNSGSLVNFTAGTKDVFVTQPSEKAVYLNGGNNVTLPAGLTATSITDTGLTSGRVTYATTGGLLTDSANIVFDGSTLTTLNTAYTGTLTGGTGVVNLGSGQFYKDASGNVGIGTTAPITSSGTPSLTIGGGGAQTPSITLYSATQQGQISFAKGLTGTDPYDGYMLYSSSSRYMAFGTSATERMRIDSSGNVGIGTTTPTFGTGGGIQVKNSSVANLRVSAGSSTGFDFAQSTAGDSYIWNRDNSYIAIGTNNAERMRIDSSGNVGVGTSSPASKLDVKAGSGFVISRSTSGYNFKAYYDDGRTTYTAIAYDGLYTVGAQDLILNAGAGAAQIMQFRTSDTERMRIDSSGNVGIGTSGPVTKFQVGNTTGSVAGVGSQAYIAINKPIDATSGNYPCRMIDLYAYYPGYNNSNPSATIGAGVDVSSTQNGYITFQTLLANVLNERLRIGPYGETTFDTSDLNCTSGGTSIIGPSYTSQPRIIIGHATGTISGSTYLSLMYAGSSIGSIIQNGTTGVLYNLTSDYRLKNNPVALTGASEFIMALQPKTWDWYDGSGKGVGFIAHEFMEVAKHSGNGEKDAVDAEGKPIYQAIQPSSSEVMANLVALVQELKAEIDLLKGTK